MPFQKGVSGNIRGKPGGIKDRVNYNVGQILKEIKIRKKDGTLMEGINPFIQLAELAVNAKSEKVRADATIELCSYCAPKLKSIEFTGENAKPFSVVLNLGAPPNKEEKIVPGETK